MKLIRNRIACNTFPEQESGYSYDSLDKITKHYIEMAMREYGVEMIKRFIDWHNEEHPDIYIPNSRLGQFNLLNDNKP